MPRPSSQRPGGLLRILLLTAGIALIIVSPIVGAIPGPGGIFVFAGGLVLVLQNSQFARRHFVKAKRRWPRLGALADKALRRRSAKRRQSRRSQAPR